MRVEKVERPPFAVTQSLALWSLSRACAREIFDTVCDVA